MVETSPPANKITIRRGRVADTAAISRAHYEALDQFHEFYGTFFKMHPRELIPMMTGRAFAETAPAQVFYVAEDGGTGDVVGFVRYSIKEARKEEEKEKEKEDEEKKKKREDGESPFACKEELREVWKAFNEAQGERDATLEGAAKGQRHMWIQHLMIRPSHQRRGVGRALLSTALECADAEGLPSVIVSSAESVRLYSQAGFASLDSFRLDNGHWAREAARAMADAREGEGLVARYDGVFEVEDVMVRDARGGEVPV
ncbi:Acyl-CoA N-acyltransferase [Cordyceps fumosorosea ARSEF 2679]|uniref:Acyl-CoA N-acyltransferase n=1 Tax=Cordyceps fumosorosea (strain ARSEF 2679) TaxID=1081104 RepID=A0A162LJQ1_CORFA|nr:Acyl-CoA N-acyltransferase [Cordyceps fumosorosea ARSEF 2679]OAA71524.1 Acyl-CoA N-acyltransferase [Cordyceps fumosorosea ARSEF 2679]